MIILQTRLSEKTTSVLIKWSVTTPFLLRFPASAIRRIMTTSWSWHLFCFQSLGHSAGIINHLSSDIQDYARALIVRFNVLCVMAVATPVVFSLVCPFHPLSNLQLLQSVLVHLSLGQDETDDTRWEAYHPGGEKTIVILLLMMSVENSIYYIVWMSK